MKRLASSILRLSDSADLGGTNMNSSHGRAHVGTVDINITQGERYSLSWRTAGSWTGCGVNLEPANTINVVVDLMVELGLPAAALRVEFETPQRAVAPGQSAVILRGDPVLGGGRIAA
jgi:hypothetical protein